MEEFDRHSDEKDFFEGLDFGPSQPKQGKILISEPFLFDPYFKRTVVLLAEHNDEGSIGFILNKPVKVGINGVVEDFPRFDADVYFGGPVGNNNLFYIHTKKGLLEGSKKIIPGLYWGGDFDKLKLAIDTGQVTENDIRFFVGYSGWGEGQLDDEINEKSWIVSKTNISQVMNKSPEDYWKNTLKGLGKKFAIMANFPEDPTLN